MSSADNTNAIPAKFKFRNIGPVKNAELKLGDLTIIAGRNNTGKTYLAYTLYGFLKNWTAWPGAGNFLLNGNYTSSAPGGGTAGGLAGIGRAALDSGYIKRGVDQATLERERGAILGRLTKDFSGNALPAVFSSGADAFKDASLRVELSANSHRPMPVENQGFSLQYRDGKVIITRKNVAVRQDRRLDEFLLAHVCLQFLFPELSLTPFVLSAERFGISLFYKELDFTKNQLVDLLQEMGSSKERERFSPFFLIDKAASRYAQPIKDNIDYTRDIPYLRQEKSYFYDEQEGKLFNHIKDLMGGYYKSTREGELEFKSKARGEHGFSIPLHQASSSARGLSDLYFFLRHKARPDHLVIIDEPESHLDTRNQVQLARLLARMVRLGMKVLVTTHSDYLIKELNNLVMLSSSFTGKEKLIKKFRYREDDYLAQDKIRAYTAENRGLKPCPVDKLGIEMPVFDETINDINNVSNELAARLQNGKTDN